MLAQHGHDERDHGTQYSYFHRINFESKQASRIVDILAGLTTNELVVRRFEKWHVRHSKAIFEQMHFLESVEQKWQVVRRRKNVVGRKPGLPERPRLPFMLLQPIRRILATNIKIDHTDKTTGLKHSHRVFNRCEPVRDHRK